MARPLRIEYPGAVYHLAAHGNAREDVFLDDGDRRLFLDLLAEITASFRWLRHNMREFARAASTHYSPISKIIRAWEENSTFKT